MTSGHAAHIDWTGARLTSSGWTSILRPMRWLPLLVLTTTLLAPLAARAQSGDLAQQIEAQRTGAADLERLDVHRAAAGEVALLRTWLDEAQAKLGSDDFDRVRELLQRCLSQSELIRQKTVSADLEAKARDRQAKVKDLREKISRTRKELEDARVRRKALEMGVPK